MKRSGPPERRTRLERRKGIRRRNPERKQRLYARNFGAKSEWLREVHPHCAVTGKRYRVEHAHVGKRRGMGGCGPDGNRLILPLWWRVHRDEESNLPDSEMVARWGVTRADLVALAAELDREWRRLLERAEQ